MPRKGFQEPIACVINRDR